MSIKRESDLLSYLYTIYYFFTFDFLCAWMSLLDGYLFAVDALKWQDVFNLFSSEGFEILSKD